jgi:alanyl-tRNA synthetase
MLGNFSFGDYFKEEAIRWAWELSTGPFGLEPDRIWVTVYEEDDESFAIWRDVVAMDPARIIRRGPRLGDPKEDNFWWMRGVTGPGGPNTELFYDRGDRPSETFDDGDTMMEYWNLVFTQYEVDPEGEPLGDLPARNVDTGLGLERLAQIIQKVPTAYEADTFHPILERAQEVTGRRYGADEREDVSLRIITEHFRAASFMVGDGIVPSNEGRGYVLRRIVRRAIRRAKMLGIDDSIAPRMVDAVVETLGEAYPNLVSQRAFVEQILAGEEESFRHTLRTGLQMLSDAIEETPKGSTVAGDVAFKLHDTYGFPYELTLEIAQEAGLDVDRDRFESLMGEQRERGRAAHKVDVTDVDALREVLASAGPSAFVGYDRDEEEAKILGLVRGGARVDAAREGDEVEVVLDATPFYPEGGGQVGDAGSIETDGGLLVVTDTQRRLGDLIVHSARVERGEVTAGSGARAAVDRARRAATMRSHTATHILHASLRGALGEHARQFGSLVEPGRLRFDFAHPSRVDPAILSEVEEQVNRALLGDDLVRPYETTMDEARNRGAMMLFEEKYGDIVRVVEIGDYSIELCGGTHVTHTSQIGAVKLLGEGSISSGVRRIEALTGAEAIDGWRHQQAVLEHIAWILKTTPEEAPARVARLLDDLKAAEQQARKQQSAGQRERAAELARAAERIGEVSVVLAEVPGLAGGDLQKLASQVRDALEGPGAVILASGSNGKAAIVAALDKATAARVKAPALIAAAARAIGGGAGGKDEAAIGGGSNAAGVTEALRLARAAAEELLG